MVETKLIKSKYSPETLGGILISIIVFLFAFLSVKTPFITPDDYRYINIIQQNLPDFFLIFTKGAVVENSWDEWWWIADGTKVVFFRPFVILTYIADFLVHKDSAKGFLVTNIILHVIATLLAFKIFLFAFGSFNNKNTYALLAALLFGLHGIHLETIWYIAGRTDTIAAIFFFLTIITFHKEKNTEKYLLTSICFFLSLLAKEYNFVLPAILLLFKDPKTKVKPLFTWMAIPLVSYLSLRFWVLPKSDMLFPYPYYWFTGTSSLYLLLPAIIQQYLNGLTLGEFITNFLTDPKITWKITPAIHLISNIIFILVALSAIKKSASRKFLYFFAIAFFPILFLYTSSRYMYIPSLAWITILFFYFNSILSRKDFLHKRFLKIPFLILFFLFTIIVPIYNLHYQLNKLPDILAKDLSDSLNTIEQDINDNFDPDFHCAIAITNFENHWTYQQFLKDYLEVRLNKKLPPILFLNKGNKPPASLKVLDDKRVVIASSGVLYQRNEQEDFFSYPINDGQIIKKSFADYKVLTANDDKPTSIEVIFKGCDSDKVYFYPPKF